MSLLRSASTCLTTVLARNSRSKLESYAHSQRHRNHSTSISLKSTVFGFSSYSNPSYDEKSMKGQNEQGNTIETNINYSGLQKIDIETNIQNTRSNSLPCLEFCHSDLDGRKMDPVVLSSIAEEPYEEYLKR